MNIREEAVVDLRVDDTDAAAKWENNKTRIKELQNELKALREAGEQGSDGYKALQRELSAVKAEQTALKHDIDLSTASISQMQSALSYWVNEAKKAEQGSEEWIRATKKIEEIKPALNEANTELRSFGQEVDKQPSMWENFKVSALSVFTGMGLLELFKSAASAAWEFGKEIFEITARFEGYEKILAHSLGSQEAATKAMEDIRELAKTTPMSVDELTESYVKYVNRGLQPSMEEMKAMSDVAAVSGKSFEQLTEALLDGATGQNERFKELSINAEAMGDKVKLSFKDAEIVVDKSLEGMNQAMLYFQENATGVAGATDVMANSMEGRMEKLGDSMDELKLAIGERLKPVFNWLLEAMAVGIDTAIMLVEAFFAIPTFISNNLPLFIGLGTAILSLNAANIAAAASAIAHAAAEKGRVIVTEAAAIAQRALNLVMSANPIGAVVAAIGLLVGGFVTWYNQSEKVRAAVAGLWGALKSLGETAATVIKGLLNLDFKSVIQAINGNGANMAAAFSKGYSDKIKEVQAAQKVEDAKKDKTDLDNAGDKGNAEGLKYATEKGKAKQTQELKDEASLLKKLEDMQVKAISDDTKRAIAKADLDYKREVEAIKKSEATEATKNAILLQMEKNHEAAIQKINDDARIKEEKAESDAKKKADAAQRKKEQEEKKYRNDRLKANNKLLDDEFKAAAAKAKIELSLTKENSQAQWDAKRKILEQEAAYKTAKLAREAAEEKAQIQESIAENNRRNMEILASTGIMNAALVAENAQKAAQIQAIEERLAAETKAIETDLQTAKTQLQTDANAARKANTEEFYSALNTAMTGDMNAFLDFLKKKDNSEATSLQKRMQDNLEHVQGIGEMMNTAVNALIKLNADYTQKKLDKLKEEYDANVAKLEADYEKGIITHEELEAGKLALSEEYDAENAALKKKEFERNKKLQIASALIAGSMAVLSALATPPFFVGLALAVVAAAKTAIDIAKIKNQKFEGARGGVFKNAGVTEGSRHGSRYGDAGIVMHDRVTGEEVGEIEGGEPVMVLSRTTYRNNKPVIDRLLHSSLYRNGAPIHLERGGMFNIAAANAYRNRMYAEGGVIGYESGDTSGISDDGTTAQSQAVIEENKRVQEEMKKYQERTANGVEEIVKIVKGHTGLLTDIKNKDTGANTILHAIDRLKSNIIKASA